MEQYVIKGGTPLKGEVEISGAKNAALAILAAAIMTDETVTVTNLPDVRDINVLLQSIEGIGAIVKRESRNSVKINGGTIRSVTVDYEYIKKIRASYYLLGALLGRFNEAEVALPGGCDIGTRPIDQHIKGFKALGAEVVIEHGMIKTKAEHLVGSHIYMDVVSVGATINIIFGLLTYFILVAIVYKNIPLAIESTGGFISAIAESLKMLFTGHVGINEMTGPVGISQVVSQTTTIANYIYIIALVSVSLGVTNLLPIPALDGGKILILIIEAIRKKPLNKETEAKIQLIGFSILIALSLIVTYNDILRVTK